MQEWSPSAISFFLHLRMIRNIRICILFINRRWVKIHSVRESRLRILVILASGPEKRKAKNNRPLYASYNAPRLHPSAILRARVSTIFRRSPHEAIDFACRPSRDQRARSCQLVGSPHNRACMRMRPAAQSARIHSPADAWRGNWRIARETNVRSRRSFSPAVVINGASVVRPGVGNKRELLAALTHPKLIILDDPDEATLCRRRITRVPGTSLIDVLLRIRRTLN